MSAKADVLLALADRCEREGASKMLDIAIATAANIAWSSDEEGNYGPYGIMPSRVRFSRSLDAAVTLVPKNYTVHECWSACNHFEPEVKLWKHHTLAGAGDIEAKGATRALTLCAAALRALAQQAVEERT